MGELLDLIREIHGLPTYEKERRDKNITNDDMKEHMREQYRMLGILMNDE